MKSKAPYSFARSNSRTLLLRNLCFAGGIFLATITAAFPDENTPSALLERGLYAEKTQGDLEKAIGLYQQLIADARANRKFAAEAYLRLGECFLKQKKEIAARKAFTRVVTDYGEEKELAAKAQAQLDGGSSGAREIVLNDPDSGRGNEFVDLDAGKVLSIRDFAVKGDLSEEAQQRLLKSGFDIGVDFAGSFYGMGINGGDLRHLPERTWPLRLSPDEIASLLDEDKPGLKMVEKDGDLRFFQLPGKDGLPLMLLFRTREGTLGVMEVKGVDEEKQSIAFRYQSVGKPAPSSLELFSQIQGLKPMFKRIYAAIGSRDKSIALETLRKAKPGVKTFVESVKGTEFEASIVAAVRRLNKVEPLIKDGEWEAAEAIMDVLGRIGEGLEGQLERGVSQ